MHAWQIFQDSHAVLKNKNNCFIKYLCVQVCKPGSDRGGGIKLGRLLNMSATSMDTLGQNAITSVRLINKVVKEVCAALLQPLRMFAENRTLSDQRDDVCM